MPTICLNMIVKNEAHVIGRCLAAVKPFIDYWVIVDTGSSDGTQELIREILKDIPGELYERPWINFGHNRTEALDLARGKADYIFINDADEVIQASPGFQWPALKADAYYLQVFHQDMEFSRLALVSNRLDWRYEGVLHEYVTCDTPHRTENLQGLTVRVYSDGGRSQMNIVEKYAKDAELLEQALIDDPNNTRYVFYLAQSYRDSEQLKKSLDCYLRRAMLGGWDEEVWYSLYQVAHLSERLELTTATIVERYLNAYQCRPHRAESLTELARFFRGRREYALAYLFAAKAITIPKPGDLLFVEEPVYSWRSLDEYAIAAYWMGEYIESEKASRQLLASNLLPESQRQRVVDNLNWALRKQGLPDYQTALAPQNTDSPACPVCTTHAKHRYANTPYWVCPACDAWFQYPELPKVYHSVDEAPPEDMSEQEQEINRQLARHLFANVMASKPGPIFDIGAKLPVMASELQRLGCPALAMDGADGAEPLGHLLGVKIIGADFETWNEEEYQGHFRLITLIHCFEHIYNPIAGLRKLHRLIAPDGALFIRLPDHSVPGFERDLTTGHYSIHPFFHTLSSIQRVIAEAGFPFTIAETYPLSPGQRDFVLRPVLPATYTNQPIIALRRAGAIGDILMTLNLIPQLRERHPDHQIYYFCHPSYATSDTLGDLLSNAGVDRVIDVAQFNDWAARCALTINLVGYPLAEGYPDRPMKQHLIEYFASEMGLSCSTLPSLVAKLPTRPADAPNSPYATLQITAGWSKYKEWPQDRWQKVLAALDFPVVLIAKEHGRTLAHSIALIANADLHLGIDSFGNHLTHYRWRDETGNERQVSGVIIFGSTQANASGYPRNINLTTVLPCQPCFRENPSLSQQSRGPCINPPRSSYADDILPACIDNISVEQVIEAIRNAWNSKG